MELLVAIVLELIASEIWDKVKARYQTPDPTWADAAARSPVIQQLLGHSDPRTTSIYTAAHANDLTDTLRDAGLL